MSSVTSKPEFISLIVFLSLCFECLMTIQNKSSKRCVLKSLNSSTWLLVIQSTDIPMIQSCPKKANLCLVCFKFRITCHLIMWFEFLMVILFNFKLKTCFDWVILYTTTQGLILHLTCLPLSIYGRLLFYSSKVFEAAWIGF